MEKPELGPHSVLLRAIVGSRAHGTVMANSDTDLRTMYVVPTSHVVTMGYRPGKFKTVPGTDENAWELYRFLELSLNGNPSTLEVLLAPYETATEDGLAVRALFPHFLSRKKVGGAFRGFAQNQRNNMFSLESGRINKAVAHYLRVLYNGRELLSTGTMTVRIIDTPAGELVMQAKRGDITPSEGLRIGLEMEDEMERAFRDSVLPDEPNRDAINDYLVSVRKKNW